MLRLNKLTDYAVVVLTQMAAQPDRRVNTGALAAAIGLPETTVAKILKDMAKSGLVQSTRGAAGGYLLARPTREITVRAVIEAIDGPIAITDCVEGVTSACSAAAQCPVKGNWTKVNSAIIQALDAVTLADMMPQQKLYNIVIPTEHSDEGSGQDSSLAFGMTA